MSYIGMVICVGPLPYLETWPPIYMGQERTVMDRLRVSQSSLYVYFRYTPCLTDFTFEFIRRPIPPILSPLYWTFVELTLVRGPLSLAPRSWGKISYSLECLSTSLFYTSWYPARCRGNERLFSYKQKLEQWIALCDRKTHADDRDWMMTWTL
jgi:hypothetical protein